jgi:hypothetical protein
MLFVNTYVSPMQIWMWERLPVGRPVRVETPHAWFPQGDPIVAPTVAHLYERASGTYHVSRYAYVSYTNELDMLQPQHVSLQIWYHVF